MSVRLEGITKSFGAVRALDNVSVTIEKGTLHAIVGENGAGKTTLMRILYGALQPDSGEIKLDNQQETFKSSADATAAGIGMMSQHYSVIPELTCLQNLLLGAEGGPVFNPATEKTKAEALSKQMGFQFNWQAPAADLSPGETQKLELLKLLWRKAQIMILDEPTAMLGPAYSDSLFASMHGLVAKGATVILVTHRLPEVLNHCSQVTVMRGGQVVADKAVQETNAQELAHLIVGGEVIPAQENATKSTGQLTLELINVSAKRLANINLTVHQGEIVGVAGVDGNGQRELIEAILGLYPIQGTLKLNQENPTTTAQRIANGLRIIPEERHAEALIETWSLEDNAILGLQRNPALNYKGLLDKQQTKQAATQISNRFHTKHGGFQLPIASLSGGNQQRLVAGRALEFDPKLLVAFQPARGLDISGTSAVYQAIREKCQDGMAALVISFDLDELLEHCDRIVVMSRGHLKEAKKDRDLIGRLMVGAA
jgi:simple sugar transport system ATP-binding protein